MPTYLTFSGGLADDDGCVAEEALQNVAGAKLDPL